VITVETHETLKQLIKAHQRELVHARKSRARLNVSGSYSGQFDLKIDGILQSNAMLRSAIRNPHLWGIS
jgi:hypothetical protein